MSTEQTDDLVKFLKPFPYDLRKRKEDFPKAYIKKLMKEAYFNSLSKVKDPKQIINGQTITKSISAAKRKPARKK